MSAEETNPNPTEETGTGEGEGTGQQGTTLLGGEGEGHKVDLSTLFTEDEVKAKQEALAASKAEEERRAGLTDEERAVEDAKKAEEDAKKAGAPEKYEDFKMPEGVEVDTALVESITPIFKDLNLNQDQAQKIIDYYSKEVLPRQSEQINQQWDKIRADWETQAKADKEYGGEKFEENFHYAKKAMDQFATPELRSAMDQYGFGNHPEVIRLMVRIGKQMSEDPNLPGRSNAGAEKSPYLKYKT
jgi:hypothetical protein